MIAFVLGGLGWMLSEYVIHRFVGHGRRRAPEPRWWQLAAQFQHEHLLHHANPAYFAAWWRKVLAAAVAVPLIAAVASLMAGVEHGFKFAAGYGLVYALYELLHRRIHSAAPLGAYGRWARRHHLLHHFRTPRLNHGVTSPLFDVVFRTHAPAALPLRVPRKNAPVWLLDGAGEVRARFRSDYLV